MMAAPPVVAGAVNATRAEPLPPVTVPMTGAPGTVAALLVDELLLAELLDAILLVDVLLLAELLEALDPAPPPPQPVMSSRRATTAAGTMIPLIGRFIRLWLWLLQL